MRCGVCARPAIAGLAHTPQRMAPLPLQPLQVKGSKSLPLRKRGASALGGSPEGRALWWGPGAKPLPFCQIWLDPLKEFAERSSARLICRKFRHWLSETTSGRRTWQFCEGADGECLKPTATWSK